MQVEHTCLSKRVGMLTSECIDATAAMQEIKAAAAQNRSALTARLNATLVAALSANARLKEEMASKEQEVRLLKAKQHECELQLQHALAAPLTAGELQLRCSCYFFFMLFLSARVQKLAHLLVLEYKC